MPTIEVLTASAASGHYWTYTTAPPTQLHGGAGSAPATLGRGGRATRQAGGAAAGFPGELSAAAQRKILARLADLDRDNYRDVAIPVGSRAAGGKAAPRSTQNVRRILASQKTFVNHLADEEALNPRRSASRTPFEDDDDDGGDGATPAPPARNEATQTQKLKDAAAPSLDGGPPVGYTRAAAKPSKRPQRQFCGVCGYWGNYRCGKCPARYCSIKCGETHKEEKCAGF